MIQDFPRSLRLRLCASTATGKGSIPGGRTKIWHAIWCCQKKKKLMAHAFELWCWRRLMRVPRTPRRSEQSILKEISPEYSLEGLMLELKLQYFDHLMRRTDLLEKTLMLGKIESRRSGCQRMASPI